MNTEKLIAKGVEKHFDGQKVLFKVESLKEHFDGLQIHESDIVEIQEEVKSDDDGTEKQFVAVQYVIAADVNFDNATANEVAPKEEQPIAPETSGMAYEEAEKELKAGNLIALPEWGGFWFKNLNLDSDEVLVLTKEGEITNTPFEEFKERKDWIKVKATEEQQVLLDNYFAVLQGPIDGVNVVGAETIISDEVAGSPETAQDTNLTQE